jgi:nicotine blue oxidoreductase
MPQMRITAVLLAAGEGRRIGRPKALLPIGGGTFLSHTAELLGRRGVDRVVAVIGAEALNVRQAAGALSVVENPRYAEGMLSSILAGLTASGDAEAVLLHPVDHPLVDPATIDRVIAALQAGATMAVPSFGGHRGHPGGFSRASWSALRAVDPTRGARGVLADHPEWLVHVAGDAGCVAGINTRADYERLIGPLSP